MEKEKKKIKGDEKVGGGAWPLKRRGDGLQSLGKHGSKSSAPHEVGSGVATQTVWGPG